MKLRFDDTVEAFRAEFLEWLAVNRPPVEEIEADPPRPGRKHVVNRRATSINKTSPA